MLHKRVRLLLLAMLLMSLALVACGGETEEPTPEPTEAAEVEPTEEPAEEPTEAAEVVEPTEEPVEEPTEEPAPEPTEEPTPEPMEEPAMAMSDFSNEESGLAIQYPDGWYNEDLFGLAAFATSEEFLDGGPESGDEGAVALAVSFPEEEITSDDPAELVATASEQFPIGGVESIGDVVEGTAVNGAPTAYAIVEGVSDSGETPLTVFYGVIVDGDYAAALIGATPTEGSDEYIPAFQSMLASIQLSEPVLPDLGSDVLTPTVDTLIFYGDTLDGALETEDASARYNFIGFADEVVNITVTPNEEDFDLVVDVVDANDESIIDGGYVDASFGEEVVEGLVIPDNGDYYIVVTGFAGSVGTFSINIEQVEGADAGSDTITAPVATGVLAVDEAAEGVVTEEANSSWVFSANEGDVVSIVVTPEEGFDLVVDVVDANGASILPTGEVDSSFGEETIEGLTIPATGDYTIVVRGFADEVGAFSVTLSSSNSAGAPANAGDNTLGYGSVVQGYVPADGSEVWSFVGFAGEEVMVVVTPTDDEFDSVLRVTDSAGVSILDVEEVDVFGSEEVTFTVALDGEYLIEVSGFIGSAGAYQLTLLEQFNVEDPGSYLQTVYTLDEVGEEHPFPFSASAGDVVVAVITPRSSDAPVDVIVEIYEDLAEDVLLETVDATVGDTEEVVFNVPADGNYSFTVKAADGSSGSYDIILVGSPATEILLAGGDVIYGAWAEGDIIRYRLSGFAGSTFAIALNTDEDADGVIRITDADGNEIVELDNEFTGEVEYIAYTFEEDADIVIEVREYFEEAGQFILTIDELPQ